MYFNNFFLSKISKLHALLHFQILLHQLIRIVVMKYMDVCKHHMSKPKHTPSRSSVTSHFVHTYINFYANSFSANYRRRNIMNADNSGMHVPSDSYV